MVREYFDDYIKYFENEWVWRISDEKGNDDLYLKFRARKSPDTDILPDFSSIEKDANQFGLRSCSFKDIFGIEWKGSKGTHRIIGAPDYEQHLYYDNSDEENPDGESDIIVSDKYTRKDPPKHYLILNNSKSSGLKRYIYFKDILDVDYHYYVENHLFKDTHIECIFENGDRITIYSDGNNYKLILDELVKQKKTKLVEKLLNSINTHFNALKCHSDEDVRSYYPGKTAEEYFGIDLKSLTK